MPFSESMHTVAELQYLSLHGGGSAAVGPWKGRYREQALRHANPFGNLNDNLPLGQAPCTEWTKCLRLTISDEGCIVYSLEGHVDCSLAAMISVILTGLAVVNLVPLCRNVCLEGLRILFYGVQELVELA
mmetsp:Transcript_26811/g.55242  ORF Transcript_26811/g.55242 Transcript_26811/m.55242 type:complete len:130 (-) Transcript_26811:273-662(-)